MFWNKEKKSKRVEPSTGEDVKPSEQDFDYPLVTSSELIEKIENKAIQQKAPQPRGADGTAMDSACLPSTNLYNADYGTVNPVVMSYFVSADSFIGYHSMAVIAQNWLVQKACSMKVRDAAKKWFKLSVTDSDEIGTDELKRIERMNKKHKLKQNVIQACKFNNVFGIRHVLFKHSDPNFDYSQPFNPEDFANGKYAGMSQIDPYHMSPEFENEDLSDVSRIGYFEPTYWNIQGKRYHRSHFVVLMGDEVPDYLKPTYRYGGLSLVQKIYMRVYAAEKTANEAPKLTMTKRTLVRFMDLAKALKDKSSFLKKMLFATQNRDNHGVWLADTDESIQQIETTLSGLQDVITGQFQIVCSMAGIPESQFMGTGHAGLGTGETDDDYYIEDLEELQHNDMQDIIEAHHARLLPSLGIDLNLEITWNPIKVMSEKEKADTAFLKSQTAVNYYNTGSFDNVDVRQAAVDDPNSPFYGQAMPDEVIDDELDGYAEDEALYEITGEAIDAEYQGKTVTLNKPFRTPGESKKYAVYVKDGDTVKIVRFGDPDMEIKRDNPEARASFRARHDCENKTDKTKPGYWSCKFWSSKSVSELLDG